MHGTMKVKWMILVNNEIGFISDILMQNNSLPQDVLNVVRGDGLKLVYKLEFNCK
jgi:hypothetical protein